MNVEWEDDDDVKMNETKCETSIATAKMISLFRIALENDDVFD